MRDETFEAPARIAEILGDSYRLRYVLTNAHGIQVDDVTALRLDGDNTKIDVWVGDRMVRFKARGTQHVLATRPSGGMAMELDPALAQAIYALVHDHLG